jgi:signal transduction histidine kinase
LTSAVLLFNDRDLKVAAARHLASHDNQATFTAENGALKASLASAEPVHLKNPAADPELGRLVALHDCSSALVLPLRRGLNIYGVMLFAHPDTAFFTPDRTQALQMISHQAVIAIQNARLYQDLAQEKERIVQTQEETRHKLARDLHDGPIQIVSAIAMRAEAAERLAAQKPGEIVGELAAIQQMARSTARELRTMLFTLRPLALENDGLVPALQSMAEKNQETYQQNIQLDIDPASAARLEANKASVVFYLCEEAINNARKHARASLVLIRLTPHPSCEDIVELNIIDNGIGFNVREVLGSYEKRGSLGMVNLQERADLINGVLDIDSVPGKGTRVRVRIPLSDQAADLLQRGQVA